ncbi:MAG TPA: EAL domain-containing protein [Acidobacteriaceae bacterium]|nr:EAL domain-containing protein [Acidobacteriaceae bacterium]
MLKVHSETANGCVACRKGSGLGFELTMAFQPIVDAQRRSVFAYEALVRGIGGLSAAQVLSMVNEENRYAFDQTCRVKAIELAARLGIAERGAKLSVNFMPGAVYSPAACIRRTLQAATFHRFPLDAIIFEITEGERVQDTAHLQGIAAEYARHGFTLALDDFGAGFSGLNLLSELEGIRLLKLDGALIRGIENNDRAQRIVRSMVLLCDGLGIKVLAECVETAAEYTSLRECGIELMQGYLFARPELEQLPAIQWPDAAQSTSFELGDTARNEQVPVSA